MCPTKSSKSCGVVILGNKKLHFVLLQQFKDNAGGIIYVEKEKYHFIIFLMPQTEKIQTYFTGSADYCNYGLSDYSAGRHFSDIR